MRDDNDVLAELDSVPSLFVTEVGIGACQVNLDGKPVHRVLRLYQPEGAIDLVLPEAVALEVGRQLAQPLRPDERLVVDCSDPVVADVVH